MRAAPGAEVSIAGGFVSFSPRCGERRRKQRATNKMKPEIR